MTKNKLFKIPISIKLIIVICIFLKPVILMGILALVRKVLSKEKELLECIIQGLDNKEIARQLFLSEGTIRNYISQLLDKFDCKNRTR